MYVFDRNGRHLATKDALTGATLLTFSYDSAGRLAAVTDADGDALGVERSASGDPTALMAPFGQRTALALGPDGYLATVTDPDPASLGFGFTYEREGLLTAMTDRRGSTFTFTHDGNGRLLRDASPETLRQDLARTEVAGGFEVARTTTLGRRTTYGLTTNSAGITTRRTVDPAGFATVNVTRPDGSFETTTPDGAFASGVLAPDPPTSI